MSRDARRRHWAVLLLLPLALLAAAVFPAGQPSESDRETATRVHKQALCRRDDHWLRGRRPAPRSLARAAHDPDLDDPVGATLFCRDVPLMPSEGPRGPTRS